jgi:GH15 family glucan-1,4-alpha-glucosidase
MGLALDRARLDALARRSVQIISDNQAASGAYLASPEFKVYRFSWLRDGAFIADAMSRSGEPASASAFFGWCARVVEGRAHRISDLVARRGAGEHVPPGEMLHTRYTVEGRESHDDWWNFQLDGYGAWLWALGAHVTRPGNRLDLLSLAPAVEATGRYLVAFATEPGYDCWEENPEHVHTATLAAIAAGLHVVAAWPGVAGSVAGAAEEQLRTIEARVRVEGVRDGHLVKWLGGGDLDASLIFCAVPYRLFEATDPLMRATVAALSPQLAHGGVHRHAADVFYGGGEWVLLAAALGSYLVAVGDLPGAREQLAWVAAQADADGHLPEQVSRHLLHPGSRAEWVERWGPVAQPLLWSHAMYLGLIHDLAAA